MGNKASTDGGVDNELKKAFQTASQAPLTEEQCNPLLAKYDTDANGALSKTEAAPFIRDILSLSKAEAVVAQKKHNKTLVKDVEVWFPLLRRNLC
jgi:hypothetical protein